MISNGNPGLFQLDPLNRVYPVFGDSSTQYQMAQSNSHVYGRLDHQLSYLLFGDIRMGVNPAGSGPFSTAEGFVSQPGDAPSNLSRAGDYNRNVVGPRSILRTSATTLLRWKARDRIQPSPETFSPARRSGSFSFRTWALCREPTTEY